MEKHGATTQHRTKLLFGANLSSRWQTFSNLQFSEENQLNKGLAGGALNTYLLNLTFFFIKDSLTSGALLLLSGAALLLVRRRTLVLTLGLRETLCARPGFKFPFTSRMENVLLCFHFVLLCWIRFPYFKDGKWFTLLEIGRGCRFFPWQRKGKERRERRREGRE